MLRDLRLFGAGFLAATALMIWLLEPTTPIVPGITPEQCTTLCDGAVVAWAPDSCVCDVQVGEIAWGAL